MAEIDWPAFAGAVRTGLAREGLSMRRAVARWPGTSVALWSRAASASRPVSAANYLLVCRLLGLDPFAFWRAGGSERPDRRAAARTIGQILKTMKKQGVSPRVSREMEGRR